MLSTMTAFGIAVGSTSLVSYALMTRLQNRRADRRSPGDGSGPDGGNHAGGDGRSFTSWFGGDNSVSDGSGNPVDSGTGEATAEEEATAIELRAREKAAAF